MRFADFFRSMTGSRILVYGDFIDPFAYIGFHTAKQAADRRGIPVEWRGFEQNPDTPPEGYALATADNSELRPGMWASVRAYAQQVGLQFPEPQRVPNTRAALTLAEAARGERQAAVTERLFEISFKHQEDIGRADVLKRVMDEFQIPPEAVRHAAGSSFLETHRQEALQRQFAGLPGFVYRGETRFGALSEKAWSEVL